MLTPADYVSKIARRIRRIRGNELPPVIDRDGNPFLTDPDKMHSVDEAPRPDEPLAPRPPLHGGEQP